MTVPETALRRRGPGLVMSLNCCSGDKAVYFPHYRCFIKNGRSNVPSKNYWVNKMFK